jgi:hypothetical protein
LAFADRKDAASEGADAIVALEDASNEGHELREQSKYSPLVAYINERLDRAEDARRMDELRWLEAYRNFRGVYSPDMMFTDAERSRVFVKITKTKVLAAYGQLIDVLFSGNRFPIGIEPTVLPEGVKESVHIDPMEQPAPEAEASKGPVDPYGYAGDGKEIAPGATITSLLGPLTDILEGLDVKDGPGLTPTSITYEPAMVAAKKMEKKINDQLEESGASKHLRHTALEMCIFGNGVLKGPFAYNKEYPKWDDEGKYTPITKLMPRVETVSTWNFYPDPDANCIEECEHVIERHRFNRSEMRALKRRPHFRREAVEAAIKSGHNYLKKWWEDDLRDNQDNYTVERFEVLEFWGVIDRELAEVAGLEIPDELDDLDEFQINAWVCGPHILRLVMNPFTPQTIPYHSCPYEVNPYSFFGVGIPENMSDTQMLMNGFMRMAVDNAVLSGNNIFEVDESMLVPGQDLRMFPGKVFRREGGMPGQALHSINVQNMTQANLMIFDKARALADESTGISSYSHGTTGIQGSNPGRTAAGASMLMGAAAGNIKTVVKNIDDYLLTPLGKALFAFNMQFDFDPTIKGDLEVRSRGTDSLMRNEVRSQRLMSFLQVVGGNQNLAPFAKFPYLIREIASAMDLDADKVTNNPDEAQRQALLLQQMGGQATPQGTPGAPPGANPMDPTGAGGGNIGVGTAPAPGMPGFSGAPPAAPPAPGGMNG